MAEHKSEATRKLGDALRKARGQVSQQDVATAALINPRNYGAYERGETEMGMHMLFRLAKVLGTSASDLLSEISESDVPDIVHLKTAAEARESRIAQRRGVRRA